jgi:hypothetical protein
MHSFPLNYSNFGLNPKIFIPYFLDCAKFHQLWEWLIPWSNHKGANTQSRQETFESSSLRGFVVYESPFF